ncbi:MAG: hypothetical protein H7A12_13655 [Pseudomonadales bacterium]|jgi:hypothetical protein|nr:hypothetical protein [Pseudomonadales bacterium]
MRTQHSRERGVALATALILLTVVTLISIYAASSGALGLHMAKNMQDAFDSFQKAEAGVAAVVSLGGISSSPFNSAIVSSPNIEPLKDHTDLLDELNADGGTLDMTITMNLRANVCPRMELASSADLIACDHFRVDAEHSNDRARSRVAQGIVKPVIGESKF